MQGPSGEVLRGKKEGYHALKKEWIWHQESGGWSLGRFNQEPLVPLMIPCCPEREALFRNF